jgi:hypothetical protein
MPDHRGEITPELLRVIREVEDRTVTDRRPESAAEALFAGLIASDPAVLGLLEATFAKVAAADAAKDTAALRDALLDLAALAADFAARQPRAVLRRPGRAAAEAA